MNNLRNTLWVGPWLMVFNLSLAQNQVAPEGGKYLSYEQVAGDIAIFIYSFNGDKKQLTWHPSPDYNPQWSPDGKLIYFYRMDTAKQTADVFRLSLTKNKEQRLTNNQAYSSDPCASSDGQVIAYTSDLDGDFEIFTMSSDGTGKRQLTFNTHRDWSPDWSPDQLQLTFVADAAGHFELYRMNADGTGQQQLTNLGGENYKPDWSPDGKWIAFIHRKDKEAKFDIMLWSTVTNEVFNITRSKKEDEFSCGWWQDEFFFYTEHGLKSYSTKTLTISTIVEK